MKRYVVKFFKDVMGENGHEAEICQAVMEVEAATPSAAAESGKRKVCEDARLSDWSLHADRVLVAEAEYPS